ncbi:MAG: hypothetical protein ACFFE2_11470 [Candidatus Thorarchaeota archaeon]
MTAVGGDAGKMADENQKDEPFIMRRNRNPRLRTLESLYYDYARIK